jgi:hypothetical protein
MIKGFSVPRGLVAFQSRRLSLNISSRTIPAAGAVAFGVLAAAWGLQPGEGLVGEKAEENRAAMESAAPQSAARYGGLLVNLRAHARQKSALAVPEPVPASLPAPFAASKSEMRLGSLEETVAQSPIAQAPAIEARLEVAPPEFPLPPQKPDELETAQEAPAAQVEAPQPPRRPGGLAPVASLPPAAPAPRVAARRMRQSVAAAQPAPAADDNRSFVEKIFGGFSSQSPQQQQPPGRSLAYAAPEAGVRGGVTSIARSTAALPTAQRYDRYTAIYDISAHVVHLPNGQRLEAHSGLGGRIDDPRFVHEKMRGPTPPNLYELTPREALFHGVQALRLTPIGAQTVYGRSGLLAHTYMLGPNGDSNGCVSFRDYQAFLRAYQNGEIRRLAVVARLD